MRSAIDGLIEHGRGDAESIAQLARPRVAKAGRADDERVLDPAALDQFRQDQPGLDRLAQPDRVGEQHPRGAADHRERGLELIRPSARSTQLRPPSTDTTCRVRPTMAASAERNTSPSRPARSFTVGDQDAADRTDRSRAGARRRSIDRGLRASAACTHQSAARGSTSTSRRGPRAALLARNGTARGDGCKRRPPDSGRRDSGGCRDVCASRRSSFCDDDA